MSRSYMFFMAACLGLAIYFYRVNALVSLFFLLIFVGGCYAAGKLG